MDNRTHHMQGHPQEVIEAIQDLALMSPGDALRAIAEIADEAGPNAVDGISRVISMLTDVDIERRRIYSRMQDVFDGKASEEIVAMQA